MRFSPAQALQIHAVLKKHFKGTFYKLYLYGSRTKDDLKGGDLDLILVTSDEGKILFQKLHLDILVEIKKQPDIGQRRIDLKAATQNDLLTDAFLKSISQDMIEL